MAGAPSERQQLWHAQAWPIRECMRDYLVSVAGSIVTPKDPFGQALAYRRN
jgi:hypothetical protein